MSQTNDAANSGPGYARNPDHLVRVGPAAGPRRATWNGTVIAQSTAALEIRESGYDPVIYFPAADVRLDLASRSERRTHCPFKGDASYWRFGGADIAWSYETPYDEGAEIAGHIAFYADQVEITD